MQDESSKPLPSPKNLEKRGDSRNFWDIIRKQGAGRVISCTDFAPPPPGKFLMPAQQNMTQSKISEGPHDNLFNIESEWSLLSTNKYKQVNSRQNDKTYFLGIIDILTNFKYARQTN